MRTIRWLLDEGGTWEDVKLRLAAFGKTQGRVEDAFLFDALVFRGSRAAGTMSDVMMEDGDLDWLFGEGAGEVASDNGELLPDDFRFDLDVDGEGCRLLFREPGTATSGAFPGCS